MTTNNTRAWEELRAAGGELANCSDYDDIVRIVSRLAPYFEVPRSPEAEAANVFLGELRDALDEAALWAEARAPAPDDGAIQPKAAE
jgi:hypothetical protein